MTWHRQASDGEGSERITREAVESAANTSIRNIFNTLTGFSFNSARKYKRGVHQKMSEDERKNSWQQRKKLKKGHHYKNIAI